MLFYQINGVKKGLRLFSLINNNINRKNKIKNLIQFRGAIFLSDVMFGKEKLFYV